MNQAASPKPLLSSAFPAAASLIQERLPLLADPCSRLLWDDSSEGILTFIAASQADYEFLSAGTNWVRIKECFPAGTDIRLIFDSTPTVDASRPPAPNTGSNITEEASRPRRPTKLNTRQLFQLLEWMRQNEPDVRNLPDTKLAQMASAALDFAITTVNFSHARESAQIEKTVPNKPKTLEERVEHLEKINSELMTILGATSKVILENWQKGILFKPDGTAETLESAANHSTGVASTEATNQPTLL